MNVKLFCAFAGAALAALAALTVVPPTQVSAGSCQRQVWIDPQVSAAEGAGTLTFAVHTRGCAAAGYVSYVVTDRSARRPADFTAGNGQLQWGGGDGTRRTITVQVAPDAVPEAAIEDFTVMLVNPSPAVTVEVAAGHGRILDDDTGARTVVIDDQSCPALGAIALPQARPSGPDLAMCPMDNGNIGFAIVANIGHVLPSLHVRTYDITMRAGVHYRAFDGVVSPSAPVGVEVFAGASGQFGVEIVQASDGFIAADSSAVGVQRP